MRTLYIPNKIDEYLDLAYIDECFNGLIICYKEDNPVGYIYHEDEDWLFANTISVENYTEYNTILYKLISSLLDDKICNNFKVIEFTNENN